MRRKDREVTDPQDLRDIIESCKVLRIALFDGKYPYVVPVNFGYDWEEKLSFYVHGARIGKKIDLLKANPHVAIEMDSGHVLVEGDGRPDHFSYLYRSLMGQGVVELLEDPAEKSHGLQRLMDHQVKTSYSEMNNGMIKQTGVIKITLENFSGKQHLSK